MFNRFVAGIVLICGLLVSGNAGAQSCLNASAGGDDTICSNSCVNLTSTINGTKSSTSYIYSSIPYTPYPYGGGNPVIVNLDDVWSPVINIPFCFEFYGTVYNQLVIGTNGLVSFDVTQANSVCPWTINTAAPNPALPMNAIMGPYQDINPMLPTDSGLTSINWQVYGSSPCRVMVINWHDVAMFGAGCDTMVATSQIVLHESTNIIDIFIQEKNGCPLWNNGAAIEGLQNANGTQAITAPTQNYPTVWAATNDGVRFSPSGAPAYTVQWFDASNTLIGTSQNLQVCPGQTTTYTLVVVNNTCAGNPLTFTDNVTIFVTQSNLAVTYTNTVPTCNNTCNGVINVNATNGVPNYIYTWSPAGAGNGPNASGLCSGLYSCTVTDATGCSVTVAVNLTSPPPFSLTGVSTPTGCSSAVGTAGVLITGGTGPFTYLWPNGDTTSSISNLQAGTYLVIVTDSAGCPDSIPVNVPSTGFNIAMTNTSLLCNGDCNATATANPSGGAAPYSYSWLPYGGINQTASGLCSGFYVVTVTDTTGCTSTASVTISSPAPIVVVPSSNITICRGQSTVLAVSVTGGTQPYLYSWNNNLPNAPSHTISPTQTTIYSVQITDANGCQSPIQNTQVKVNPVPVANFSSSPTDCPPSEVFFTNLTDTALTYLWDFGDPSSGSANSSTAYAPSHVYNSGGNYTVTLIATNIYGCADTISIPAGVIVPPAPAVSLSASSQLLSILDPVSTFYNNTSGAISYFIDFGDGDTLSTTSIGPYVHTYDSLGSYQVMLIAWDATGCSDTSWLTLIIEEPTSLYIPNAFTPNGDGTNDIFMVGAVNVNEFELLIFDRWGMLIYSSKDVNAGWNGTYNEEKCQEDVYVWRLKYTDNHDNRYERIGHVSLIR